MGLIHYDLPLKHVHLGCCANHSWSIFVKRTLTALNTHIKVSAYWGSWTFLMEGVLRYIHMQRVLLIFSALTLLVGYQEADAPCGAGAPLFPPCPFTSLSFPLLLFPFFYWLYLFSSFVQPNLGLVSFFCVCNSCYLYSLVKMHCGVFWFSFVCSFSALTLLVGSFDP